VGTTPEPEIIVYVGGLVNAALKNQTIDIYSFTLSFI
jgi:hypothetical protein